MLEWLVGLITDLVSWILELLTSVINFPEVPAGMVSAVNMILGYLKSGMGIVNFFLPLDLVAPAIDFFLLAWGALHAYRVVMWVLRKIPFFGVS